MKFLRDLIIAVVTFIIMAWGFQIWFKDWILVWILMGSIALHEIGHILSLLAFGHKARLLFIPFVGAATIPVNKEGFKRIKWSKSGTIFLSGPTANLLITIIATLVYFLNPDSTVDRYALITIGLNTSLGVWNLIPFGGMDGEGYTTAIFESLPGYKEKKFLLAIRITVLLVVVGLVIFAKSSGVFFSFIILSWTIGNAANKDDERNAFSARAMSIRTAKIMTSWYILLFTVMLIAQVLTPGWIKLTGIAIWPFFILLGTALLISIMAAIFKRAEQS